MPTFNTPTVLDTPVAVPGGRAWPLFRFYDPMDRGLTIWRDRDGVWHESTDPSHGEEYDTTIWDHESAGNPQHTTVGPTSGLGNAQAVYLGGHVYEITAQEAIELTAAGYGAYIT